MYAFADQEREFSKALRKERSEGARSQMEEDAKGMYAEGIKPDVIARIQKTSVDVIEGILGLQRVWGLWAGYSLTQEQAEEYVLAPVTMWYRWREERRYENFSGIVLYKIGNLV